MISMNLFQILDKLDLKIKRKTFQNDALKDYHLINANTNLIYMKGTLNTLTIIIVNNIY